MYGIAIDSPYIPRAVGDQALPRQGAVRSASTPNGSVSWRMSSAEAVDLAMRTGQPEPGRQESQSELSMKSLEMSRQTLPSTLRIARRLQGTASGILVGLALASGSMSASAGTGGLDATVTCV